jgi:hypothetical protein
MQQPAATGRAVQAHLARAEILLTQYILYRLLNY